MSRTGTIATQRKMHFDDNALIPLLYGGHNKHLHHLEKNLDVEISDRGNTLVLDGDEIAVDRAERVLAVLWEKILQNHDISFPEIDAAIRFVEGSDKDLPGAGAQSSTSAGTKDAGEDKLLDKTKGIATRKKQISPRSPNQAKYVESLRNFDLVFGIGPGGTGKTYLAVGMAVEMLEKGEVDRLIFCRPAVEAGEKLGFLPGDMKEKLDPYLRPIYDALHDFLGVERTEKMIARNEIEVAPLAFMRGRTLSRAYVVLDEAQNTTSSQMKMFLSRMGENSRMVVTGDPDQTDLLPGQISGLSEAVDLLGNMNDVAIITFRNKDVVRHRLVGKILQAYDNAK